LKLHLKAWIAGSAGAVSVGTAAVLVAAFSAGASASLASHTNAHHVRPGARALAAARTGTSTTTLYHVKPFVQDFSSNLRYFCPPNSGNAPCDGVAPNDFGTIDRVLGRYSNGGGGAYAPFTRALHGKWMAVVSGTQTINQGPSQGCPVAGTEACTGPYALFGTGKAMGAENVFPQGGFTVTNDLYLSPGTVTNAGTLVDDDIAMNNNLGQFRIDNVITACAEPVPGTTQMGFVINFSNNSPGSCTGTPVITTAGWYRFVFVFRNHNGDAYLTMSVRSERTGHLMASTGMQPIGGTATPISSWGGPLYFWLPTLDMSGLPLANFALQLGAHPAGNRP
jgi:hypothetical protein